MPVPSSISDLSTTAASNNPPGTEAIGTLADDYIRASAAFIRRESNKGADVASASALAPGTDGNYFVVTGNVTINSIANSWLGRRITLRFDSTPTLIHSSPALLLPGGASIAAVAGAIGEFVQEDSAGNWRCISFSSGNSKFRLIDVQYFTANGTWTKPTGTAAVRTFGLGGGGAGGGAGATTASQYSLGAGGGAGAFIDEFITTGLGATETVTVGAGGTGVSGGTGNTGGATSFGAHWTANGGVGGGSFTAALTASIAAVGGLGGTSSGGNINGAGAPGGNIVGVTNGTTTVYTLSGHGANSPYGGGGQSASLSAAGNSGSGLGSGGGGASNEVSQAARSGGPGLFGFIAVESYAF